MSAETDAPARETLIVCPLSRPVRSSPGESARDERLPLLDGWRGAAILGVLMGHFIGLPGINAGLLGVELFFVLSGRLMAEILFVRQTPLPIFLARRFSRIYPALVVAVVLIYLASRWLPQLDVQIIDVIASLTFTMNYLRAIGGSFGSPLDHVWSLCVEEHAYLIMLLVAFLHRRTGLNPVTLLAGLALACAVNGIVSTYVFDQDYYQAYWRSDVRVASVLASASLYLCTRGGTRSSSRRGRPWPIIAGVLGVLTHLYGVPVPVTYTLGTLALAYSVAHIDTVEGPVRWILTSRPMQAIGIWSYSLYLYQQPFAHLSEYNLALMLTLVFATALTSYYLLERPVRHAINAWIGSKTRISPTGF